MHKLIYFLTICIGVLSAEVSDQPAEVRFQYAVQHFFPHIPLETISSTLLSGGFSEASNYKISCPTCEQQTYVIRLYPPKQSAQDLRREFWAFTQASNLGIAPKVYAASIPLKSLLTDYESRPTLSWEQAHEPDAIHRIGFGIRQIHSIPKSPYPNDSWFSAYNQMTLASQNESAAQILQLLQKYDQELSLLPPNKVTVHGDLNPRNIFINPDHVLFIDWTNTTWDDAFFDLSYFAAILDYDEAETETLLQSYLGHAPTSTDWHRYDLTYKINLLGLVMIADLASERLAEHTHEVVNDAGDLQELSYYARRFAESSDMSAQLLHDWSRAALQEVRDHGNRRSHL